MFEPKLRLMYDLFSFIPTLEDPTKTVTQDTLAYSRTYPGTTSVAFSIRARCSTPTHYGMTAQDEMEMMALNVKPERAFNDKRISDVFSEQFFETNFWHMWRTLFAFSPGTALSNCGATF